jgi:hypothetical protein
MRLAAAAVVTAVVAFAAAGCGSDDKSGGSPTSSWANDLCSAFGDWESSLEATGDQLKNGQISRATLEQAATEVSDANEKLGDDLRDLGKPPTEVATEAKDAADQLAADLKTESDKIREAASDVSSTQDALNAVSVASGALSAMAKHFSEFGDRLQSLEGKEEWQQAFEQSEACKKLSGDSG